MTQVGFLGKSGLVWRLLSSYLIPGMMTIAYVILILTSETGIVGKAWESAGLAIVLFLWFLFRALTEHAAMSRAIANGDSDRVLALADAQLARRRRAAARAPYQVYRALALEIRGDWSGALAALEGAKLEGSWRALAATVRVAAYVETERAGEARRLYDAELARIGARESAEPLARLAEGRLRLAEGDRDGATRVLRKLVDNVRAGTGTRGAAHFYLWRATGDAKELAKATQLAPTTWFAAQRGRVANP